MEVFMHNIPFYCGEFEVKVALAEHLHGPTFPNVKANFQVNLHCRKKGARTVTGTFTLADLFIARRFLQIYKPQHARAMIWVGGNRIYFQKSTNEPLPEVVEALSRSRWIDPAVEREQNQRFQILRSSHLPLNFVQFGWMCRDGVFSIENEVRSQPCHLAFEPERREIQITVLPGPESNRIYTYVIAIRQSSILSLSAHKTQEGQAIVFLQLDIPPTFLRRKSPRTPFYRLATFPLSNHPNTTPYASLAICLNLTFPGDLKMFLHLSKVADIRHIETYHVVADRRRLFRDARLGRLEERLQSFEWRVAFQLEALLRNMDLDATELLGLLPKVEKLVSCRGSLYAANLLRMFASRARCLTCKDRNTIELMLSCFDSFEQEYAKQGNIGPPTPTDDNFCETLHVTITPTTMFLTGPFLEKSNHVIRRYDRVHQECFLKVDFREEDGLQHRFDRSINARASIRDRLGPLLKDGLTVAGRKFQFLAYSQSALREHSVWFVKPFTDPKHGAVDAKRIIQSLGSFDNLSYDKTLIHCPARYGARLSQAFTATEASTVKVEEIFYEEDISTEDGKYIFTDGSGNMSEDLAREIWRVLGPKQGGTPDDFPHAIQIRFQGSKGMLSVDYKLNGSNAIALRPSMIKFDYPDSNEIEIARAINKPTPYRLNRPLIMLLEGLGVSYGVFQDFQNKAVEETKNATHSLEGAAQLLETHGLGSSFRLPSIMSNLAKLGVDKIHGDPSYDQILRIVVYHVLRDLKNSARIPIPDAWTLVGVADTHRYLQADEIFACIKRSDGEITYLEGPVLVSRSPCSHPGDAQIANAIGSPPEGSCFAREPLFNTVVFSVQGSRPLPSCLAGGDLDGDVYHLLPLSRHPWFRPMQYFQPAEYAPAEKKLLETPSTMDDIADFVMDYIVSDVVGIIATDWLIIADQSHFGIRDRACLRLAQLHSNAVDYPKTGRAVNLAVIPVPKFPKPDWNAPETIEPDPVNYYQSQSAIGKLCRAIDLKAHDPFIPVRHPQQQLDNHELPAADGAIISSAIRQYVSRHVKVDDFGGELLARKPIAALFEWFSGELANIACASSLSHRLFKPLSEEELIVGTITQKTPQPRLRKDKISKMRELTEGLVRRTRATLEGGDAKSVDERLQYLWMAWSLSLVEVRKGSFGAKSFGWVALGALLDAVKLIEEEKSGTSGLPDDHTE